MRSRFHAGLLVLAISLTPWSGASAQPWAWWPPMLMAHLGPTSGSAPACANAPASIGCSLWGGILEVQGDLGTTYDLQIMAAGIDTSGLREIELTITYNDTSGVGMDVIGWSACGDQVVAGPGWPASGSHISIAFQAPQNCQGSRPDPLVPEELPRGLVPLVTLRVLASSPDVFSMQSGSASSSEYTTCSGGTSTFTGVGSAGFGYLWGWDPCDSYYESHACYGGWYGYYCSCCFEDKACRPVAFYYSRRECHNAGGTPVQGGCSECGVPVERTTWGAIKARFLSTPEPDPASSGQSPPTTGRP